MNKGLETLVFTILTLALSASAILTNAQTAADLPKQETIRGTFTEFRLPANSQPYEITVGTDGFLYFTEYGTNRIGRISTSGKIKHFRVHTQLAGVSGIAAAPDGSIWFTEFGANKIGKLDPRTGKIQEFRTPQPYGMPTGIVAGPDGDIWYTDYFYMDIGRLSPDGKHWAHFLIDPSYQYCNSMAPCTPYGITVGPDKKLWFTIQNGFFGVGNVTVDGKLTAHMPHGSDIVGIAVGPDKRIWICEAWDDVVAKFTGNFNETDYIVPNQFSMPWMITKGPDGAMWFTENIGNNIGRITTKGKVTEFPIPTQLALPSGIVTGPDGAIWFTENYTNQIGRLH